MKKGLAYCIIIVAVLVIAAALFIFKSPSSDSESPDKAQTNIASMSEKEVYVAFEADLGCRLIGLESGEDVMTIIAQVETIASAYYLTSQEIQALTIKYKDDQNLPQMIFLEMQKQCAAKIQAAGLIGFNSSS